MQLHLPNRGQPRPLTARGYVVDPTHLRAHRNRFGGRDGYWDARGYKFERQYDEVNGGERMRLHRRQSSSDSSVSLSDLEEEMLREAQGSSSDEEAWGLLERERADIERGRRREASVLSKLPEVLHVLAALTDAHEWVQDVALGMRELLRVHRGVAPGESVPLLQPTMVRQLAAHDVFADLPAEEALAAMFVLYFAEVPQLASAREVKPRVQKDPSTGGVVALPPPPATETAPAP